MDFDEDVEYNGGKKSDKEPMYKAAPEDSEPVARRTFLITVALLTVVIAGLLVTVVMCLNGTIPPVNDRFFVRRANMTGRMDSYAVVAHTYVECRDDLPMQFRAVTLSPHPLVLPDRSFNFNFNLEMKADMPTEGMNIDVMIQHLGPPWYRVPCVDHRGSCFYENGCELIKQMFDMECSELTTGVHTGSLSNLMVDMQGKLGWIKSGNYIARVKIGYREEEFGCGFLTFRITNTP